MVEGVLGRDVAAGAADHNGKLALEVEIGRNFRTDHVAVGRHQGVDEAGEDVRQFWRFLAVFGGVRFVIDADAEDFFRIRDRRQEAHVRKLLVRLGAIGSAAHLVERATRERLT